MTDEERDQAIAELGAQVAEFPRRLDQYDAAAAAARAVMAAAIDRTRLERRHARRSRPVALMEALAAALASENQPPRVLALETRQPPRP